VFNSTWATNYYWNGSAGSITMVIVQAPPPAPTGLKATAGSAAVTLKWTASSGATSYNVYRGPAAGSEHATPVATGITTTSYINTGLTNGKTYFFKVAAVNAAGTSALSNEASAKPQAPPPPVPSAPTGLTGTPGSARVKLKWTASASAKSYNVYRGTAAGAESATPIKTGITYTYFTNTGLTTGQPYFFRVAAVDAGGTSALTSEVNATPQ
jgi:fibronectin type 3 domain-containing protein